jgi:thiamine-phosphate pyrophosphorylase
VARAQLYLIVDAVPGAAGLERARAALAAVLVASVLLRSPDGGALDVATLKPYVALIQGANVAALIDDDAELTRTLRADGVHLRAGSGLAERYTEARDVLGTRYIVGVEVGHSRHDAMTFGEAGADYIAFSDAVGAAAPLVDEDGDPVEIEAPDDLLSLAAWWADIFEVPGVVMVATSPEESQDFASTGIDFVAVVVPSTGSPGDVQAMMRAYVGDVAGVPT